MKESISKEKLLSKDVYLKKFVKDENTPKEDFNVDDDDLKSLLDEIKNITYNDIFFVKGEKYGDEIFYDVKFKNNNIDKLLYYAKNYVVKHKINGEKVKPKSFEIKISANRGNFNRVHFNNPLPKLLRGIGLGYKIYKAFGLYLGYITSDNTASKSAQKVWYYLVQDVKFNYIISKNFVFLIKSDLPTAVKIDIVKSYLGENEWMFDNEDEFDIDDELINEIE